MVMLTFMLMINVAAGTGVGDDEHQKIRVNLP